jgi:HSP20 family protein
MAESIERYLRLMPKTQRGMRCTRRVWDPAADVYRTREGWIVKFELAGVEPDKLTIEVEGDTLRVAGCRRDEVLTESVFYQQMEITYSRFERAIRFPCPIGEVVARHYRDGLLILQLRGAPECE